MLKMVNELNEFVFKSLTLDVFIIGYKAQGESIVLIVKLDGVISYSCVIDCFEYNNINKTIQILSSLNIKNVDIVCWTHPDIDHSIGLINVLSKYANKYTTVIVPENIHFCKKNVDYNTSVDSTFDLIDKYIWSKKRSTFHIRTASELTLIESKTYLFGEINYPFFILSVSPNSQLITKRLLETEVNPNKKLKNNDYSIALRVKFGKFELFFGGDIENININMMKRYLNDYIPSSFNLLKIPHHTSNSSKNMLYLLDKTKKSDMCCSTVFRPCNLPDSKLIDSYRLYSKQFLCTGFADRRMDSFEYGCIHIKYDILHGKSSIEELCGNANIVFENFLE